MDILLKAQNSIEGKRDEIEAKKQKIETNTDKKYEVLADINTQEANYENLEKRKKTLKIIKS